MTILYTLLAVQTLGGTLTVLGNTRYNRRVASLGRLLTAPLWAPALLWRNRS